MRPESAQFPINYQVTRLLDYRILTTSLFNRAYASIRVRLPGLWPSFRIPDPAGAGALLSGLCQRRAREAAVGLRSQRRGLGRTERLRRTVRNLRRSSRAWIVLDELIGPLIRFLGSPRPLTIFLPLTTNRGLKPTHTEDSVRGLYVRA